MIDTSLFPHSSFPVRLEIPQENRIAWFSDDYNLQKYLSRVKLKPKDIKVLYRDEKPIKSSKTNTNKVRQGTGKTSDRSSNTTTRSTKNLDSGRNINRARKSKPKSK